MQGVTHFIEIYKINNSIYKSSCLHIRFLDALLTESTNVSKCKTIAVWYIKPKVKTP